MWNIFFTMLFSVLTISVVTDQNATCFILLFIGLFICVAGIVITHDEQKEKIKTLEKKIERLEKFVGEKNVD